MIRNSRQKDIAAAAASVVDASCRRAMTFRSRTFRMIMVLLERGYLARDPDSDTLTLTDRLFTLGLRTPLAEATEHSLHLGVVYQGQTVMIGAASGGSEISFRLKLGFHRPALDATSGKVILAFQSADVQEAMIETLLG